MRILPANASTSTRAHRWHSRSRPACRLTIERRLVDAGFAIVKERQMQFNPDSDRDMLEELFGNDAAALNE